MRLVSGISEIFKCKLYTEYFLGFFIRLELGLCSNSQLGANKNDTYYISSYLNML